MDLTAPERPHDIDQLHLHVGLPKTATTFLQLEILRRLPDVRLVHRKLGDDQDAFIAALRQHVGHGSGTTATHDQLTEMLQALPRTGKDPSGPSPWVVSNENLSLGARGVWTGAGPEPAEVIERLHAWTTSIDATPGWARVIIGIRRQDRWLASRYAQSSKQLEGFDQDDLEARLRTMSEGELSGPVRWLLYGEVVDLLGAAFGAQHVHVVPMEGLDADPRPWLDALGTFIGASDVLAAHDAYEAARADGDAPRRNVRSLGGDRWALGSGDGEVTLTPEIGRLVRARFEHTNRDLAERTGIDLDALGYHG